MKLRILIATCLLVCASGCINYPRTHVLVTPLFVAGIHSFAPPKPAAPTQAELMARNANEEDRRSGGLDVMGQQPALDR